MSPRRPPLSGLEAALGYRFRDPDLLAQALRHASATHERGGPSFERLEFLGDAALSHAIAELLFHRFHEASEGQLTRARAVLVRGQTLAERAGELGLGARLEVGSGMSAAVVSRSVLADALEAVLGAVLLDGGWQSFQAVVAHLFGPLLEALRLEELEQEEPKSALQELAQRQGLPLPLYRQVGVEGPAHRQTYIFEVEFAGRVLATGRGSSKRIAQQAAAREALRVLAGAATASSDGTPDPGATA